MANNISNVDKIFESLKDLIISLKDNDKCKNPEFKTSWQKKKKDVYDQIEKLNQKDENELTVKFNSWMEKII